MSNKTRSFLKLLSVIIVALCILMKMSIVTIPVLSPYMFWLLVAAFGMLFLSSR